MRGVEGSGGRAIGRERPTRRARSRHHVLVTICARWELAVCSEVPAAPESLPSSVAFCRGQGPSTSGPKRPFAPRRRRQDGDSGPGSRETRFFKSDAFASNVASSADRGESTRTIELHTPRVHILHRVGETRFRKIGAFAPNIAVGPRRRSLDLTARRIRAALQTTSAWPKRDRHDARHSLRRAPTSCDRSRQPPPRHA